MTLENAAGAAQNLIFGLVMVKPDYIVEEGVVTFQNSKYHVILGVIFGMLKDNVTARKKRYLKEKIKFKRGYLL